MSKIAFIYPGQGAQKVGMGRDFYEAFPCVQETYKQASQLLGIDLCALCFEENTELDVTEYTQPAMVTTCIAISEVLIQQGVDPDVTAGLSLGEYTAIAVAGGMTKMDAIQTVRQRGVFMQHAVPLGVGAMSAVLGMKVEDIEAVVSGIEGVSIANYNCPGQLVITGTHEGVEQASQELKEQGAKRILPLNVSGPFHSPLLADAGKKLEQVLEEIQVGDLNIPYVTNVDASKVINKQQIKELLVKQITSPVLWEQSIRYLIETGVDTFIEIGPGKTLAGFIKKIDKSVTIYNINTVQDLYDIVEKIKVKM